MRSVYLIAICVIFYSVKKSAGKSIWKVLLSPDDPPLLRVRNLNQARAFGQYATLDFIGLVQQHSYPAEEHRVTTEDGYHLVIHRIPGSPRANNTKNKKVVFIQHGAASSSDLWVLSGPKKDIPYLLADDGYDVWLGNLRGNTYCRSHEYLATTNRKFWQFSFHEHGIYDLKCMVDYVLNYTQKEKLYYIGHSMGSTISYVLLSSRPEYNNKFNLLINLSPIAFWNHGVSPTLNIFAENGMALKRFFVANDIYDIGSQNIVNIILAKNICSDSSPWKNICLIIVFTLVGFDIEQLEASMIPTLLSYYPAGISIYVLEHYHQNIVSGKFQLFDHGSVDNYRLYKQRTPPLYNLSNVTAPFALFYARNDFLLTVKNAMEISKNLPNVVAFEEVPHEFFNHIDFITAKDAKTLVFDNVIALMEKF